MQTRIRDNILPYFHDQVYIARVFDHLVSPHVIVMERVRARRAPGPRPRPKARDADHAALFASVHRFPASSWWTGSRRSSPPWPPPKG